MGADRFKKDIQYYRFCLYGFLKNLRFFEPFLLLFFLENELSYLQIGVLYSILEITRNVLEIPAGFISDTLGRRKTMVTSFSFYIVSFLVFYLSHTYGYFILAMVLFAVGDAFRTGTHKAMIFTYLKLNGWEDQKVAYYGNTRSWSQIGSAISSLIAALIIFYQGSYRDIFLFTIIPYIFDLFNVMSYPSKLEGAISSETSLKESFRKVGKAFITSFRNLTIVRSLVNVSSHSGFYKAAKDYLQPVVKTFALSLPVMAAFSDKQRTAVLIGVIYFVIYLITSSASRNSGRFKDSFKTFSVPLNLTVAIGLLMGMASGLLYETQVLWLAIVFYVGIFVVENLRKPIGMGYLSNKPDESVLATVLSIESQTKSLLAALIAPLLGFLADQFGVGYSLAITSGLLLLALPVYYARKSGKNIKKAKS